MSAIGTKQTSCSTLMMSALGGKVDIADATIKLVDQIHHWMPAILEPSTYARWLEPEPDPHDLLMSYPSEPMEMWPISRRVNSPANDDAAILEPAVQATSDPLKWKLPTSA